MSRAPVSRLVLAVLGGLLLAACGSGHTSRTTTSTTGRAQSPKTTTLTVTPTAGGTTTVFSMRFIAPASTGTTSGRTLGFVLGVRGPQSAGCVSARSASIANATAGQEVTTRAEPAQAGAQWCPGTYRVRVDEVVRPSCPPGTVCPQYVRVVGTVARGSFRVQNGP